MADIIIIDGIIDTNAETCIVSLASEGIHAGSLSPAEEYMNKCVDLNKELVRHPAATFCGRVVGDSMIDAGVEEGDMLVIDKSIQPSEGDMAVCFLDGEFALKTVTFKDPSGMGEKGLWLLPANPKYKPIKVYEGSSFIVWGVVTYVIKKTYHK